MSLQSSIAVGFESSEGVLILEGALRRTALHARRRPRLLEAALPGVEALPEPLMSLQGSRVALCGHRGQAPLHTGCGAVGNAATAGVTPDLITEQAEADDMSAWMWEE